MEARRGRVLCFRCVGDRPVLWPQGGRCLSWRRHLHPLAGTDRPSGGRLRQRPGRGRSSWRTTLERFWTTIRYPVYSGFGVLLTSTKDVVDWWSQYFKDLLNPTGEEAEPGDPGISGAEVAEVVKKALVGRTPMLDEGRPEFFKALDFLGLSWFTRLCNFAWTSWAVSLDWQTRLVVPLFKKGNRRVCSNYRGITLLSLPGEVYSALGRRVRFRPEHEPVDQLYTLNRLLEGA